MKNYFRKKQIFARLAINFKKTSELFGVLGDYPYLCPKNE